MDTKETFFPKADPSAERRSRFGLECAKVERERVLVDELLGGLSEEELTALRAATLAQPGIPAFLQDLYPEDSRMLRMLMFNVHQKGELA